MQAIPGTKAAQRGLAFLRNSQRKGGGFPLGVSGTVNSQSTAWAIEGILAVGGDPGSFRRGSADPFDYLATNQAADGHYRYSGSSDKTPIWVTGEALVAVAGKSLPLEPPARETEPAPQKQVAPEANTPAPSSVEIFPPVSSPKPAAPGGIGASGAGTGAEPVVPLESGGLGAPAPGTLPPEVPGEGSAAPVPATTRPGALASRNFEPPQQSPTIPILIGVAIAAAIVLTTRALARRNGW
jgi:hypothetical protein